jgi:RimJ/RimL family protein N-acetyltransferase
MIRPFKAEDMIDIIEAGIKEDNLKLYGNDNLKELAEETEKDGLSFTGEVDGTIVGCGGVRVLWPKVGEVWMMLSPNVNGYPIKTWAVIKEGFEKIVQENDFNRLQGWCRKGFAKAHAVFKHLGFEPEGIARNYTPDGIDCVLYGLVK